MPTTSNFGWTTPADTDLVKDGAAAIRTLGNGIDSSFIDLKGGTTGQVLSKASNTDLDFTWTADASGIPATIFDAKGDIIAASAADTAARLAVGANDTVLTADSSTATGLKWATPASGGMTLISTTTLSGSSVTISSIPTTYRNLEIIIRNINPSADTTLYMRLNSDSNTRYQETTANTATNQSFGGNTFSVNTFFDAAVVNSLHKITIADYANTSTWKYFVTEAFTTNDATTTNFDWKRNNGFYNQTAAITAVTFYPDSPTTFDGGTVLLYGVK